MTIRILKSADIKKCRFVILMAEHYREDGSCRCDDPVHRRMMIREWEYKESDFEGIPLRMGGNSPCPRCGSSIPVLSTGKLASHYKYTNKEVDGVCEGEES